jgi:hypothetical protein
VNYGTRIQRIAIELVYLPSKVRYRILQETKESGILFRGIASEISGALGGVAP